MSRRRSIVARVAAVLCGLAYGVGGLALPIVHLTHHQADHSHGDLPGTIDWSSVTNRAGRVDLKKLAHALGRDEHDETKPHTHQSPAHDGTENPFDHANGSGQHFAVAALGGVEGTNNIVADFPPRSLPPEPERIAPASRLVFLKAQRAQAPPAIRGYT